MAKGSGSGGAGGSGGTGGRAVTNRKTAIIDAAVARVQSGKLTDADLTYLRSGMRDLSLHEGAYGRGVDANAIATGAAPTPNEGRVFAPIRITVETGADGSVGKIHLSDGRHRYVAARRAGATRIRAAVEVLGPRGGSLGKRTIIMPLPRR